MAVKLDLMQPNHFMGKDDNSTSNHSIEICAELALDEPKRLYVVQMINFGTSRHTGSKMWQPNENRSRTLGAYWRNGHLKLLGNLHTKRAL
jgi:hypothetical protein